MVVKRSTYEALGGFYAVHYGEDWEMWTRIASRYPIAYSPKILASYRVGSESSITQGSYVSGQNIKDIKIVIDIIQKHLPADRKTKIKNASLMYYSVYSIKAANGLL